MKSSGPPRLGITFVSSRFDEYAAGLYRKTLTIRFISLEGIGTECVGARSFLWAALYRVSLAPASASTI